ncbi:penicillin-binding protein 1A [Salinarimonas soli]|uniref:Glycosyl transferase n=1 Tax=Salinarimonas soli TaxID=1638099 RepID=A0A5B2VE18_9HYPH|nr:transglycosylase domain-containing protein [Salinarimonas soli]KAA2237331.1 glycosyl transferase [Salinarimonas soli]
MSSILVKIFATALTLSQVTTAPEAVRTSFDPVRDQGEVSRLLRQGCDHFRKAFDIEDINLDDLIATAMEDPGAVAGDVKILQGLQFGDLVSSYRLFCKGEAVSPSPVDLGEVIAYFNKAVDNLPDHTTLKNARLPGMSVVIDGKGERFAEVFEADHRRQWVPLDRISPLVRQAFIAAEDKRFPTHRGIDERGVSRAFIGNLSAPGRPQGGSTITQQVAKNLLVGDDVTYDRKMREMIVAARLERTLTKDEILEIYLNSIYLGRNSWGVEMAAQTFFGKPAKDLDLRESALIAGLAKGPNYYDPDRFPDRMRDRIAYVISRMREDGYVSPEQAQAALAKPTRTVAYERARRNGAFHLIDLVDREARTLAGIQGLSKASYTVRSTLNPALQRAAEGALQEGLARYELNTGRVAFTGPETNLTAAIDAIEKAAKGEPLAQPAWRTALERARLPLYDVQWPAAVVVQKARAKEGGEVIRVGLRDGRILPLTTWNAAIRKSLKPGDVVHVRVTEGKAGAKGGARAELRVRPSVQGALAVIENATGRILAMSGGFSYPLSQLNRATQAHRQPGSTLKPLVYLAALQHGLQPNTLIWDAPVSLPPPDGGRGEWWSPKNYDGTSSGTITLRRALENSKNLVTARLLDGGIASDPKASLSAVCDLAVEAQLYLECDRYYPFVLGAQPLRLIDLAAFYAGIANEGARPQPYALEAVEQDGRVLYRHEPKPPVFIGSADRPAFFQLKSILQGVMERGTARAYRRLGPYVAGKTGTTDNENDAWFVGFTNEVTIAVWVGYDNADGKRRTLGRGQTGSKAALPIFDAVLQASWAHHAPKTALKGPSPEAARRLASLAIDPYSGDRIGGGQGGFMEYFRLDGSGRLSETQFSLVPRAEAYAYAPGGWGADDGGDRAEDLGQDPYARSYGWNEPRPRRDPNRRGPVYNSPLWPDEDEPVRRPRRVDPDYLWGRPVY